MSESCSKNISHLLAAATYIDEEVKKPKMGRKSVISFLNTNISEDMELMFGENDSNDVKVKISAENRMFPAKEEEEDDTSNESEGDKNTEQGRTFSQKLNHKDLEKHRRAHLRECLDQLKELVPLGPDVQKHTTLGLLRKTRHILRCLEDKEKRLSGFKDQLKKENLYLKRRLEQVQQIPQGSEIGVGNTLVLPPTVFSTAASSLSSLAKPHILRKRQNPAPEPLFNLIVPQTVVPFQGNQSENFCLLVDEMDVMDMPGCSGIPIRLDQGVDNVEPRSVMIFCNGNYSSSSQRFSVIGINK